MPELQEKTLFEQKPRERTFGDSYVAEVDHDRIVTQMIRIRDFMLEQNKFLSLAEIEAALDYPQASISAQLRHLRKAKFGNYTVIKRRRTETGGTWEYKVLKG